MASRTDWALISREVTTAIRQQQERETREAQALLNAAHTAANGRLGELQLEDIRGRG